MTAFDLKDSGERRDAVTGSKRDVRAGKGRFDLLPGLPLTRLAIIYEKGAAKYGDRNWQKGQPLSWYADSAMRHMTRAIMGMEDEDHWMQAAWNCFGYVWTKAEIDAGRLPEELNDLPPQLPPSVMPPL